MFRLYLIPMGTDATSKTNILESLFSDLSPVHALILAADKVVFSSTPVTAADQKLLASARILSNLPAPSWLHLCDINKQFFFVITQRVDQDETLFLAFPLSTRIRKLEEKLVVLNQHLDGQKADPLSELLKELGAADLKSEIPTPTRSNDLLSIFSDFDMLAPEPGQNQANQGDTQPITL